MFSREDAATLLDGLDDEKLTRLISELTWLSCCQRAARDNAGGVLGDLKRMMFSAAREHCIDAIVGEPATEPLPGRV